MPKDTYSPQLNTRGSELVYDDNLKMWVAKSAQSSRSASIDEDVAFRVNTSDDPADTRYNSEKKVIDEELHTLTGDLILTPSEKSIGLRVNDTIVIQGIGSFLSGLYYVTAIKRQIDKTGGYTQTVSILKNGFGKSLKKPETTRKPVVPKAPASLKVGDKVKIVGANAVYSNAHDGVKVPLWVKKKTLTIDGISKDKNRVRLKEVWSWTYVKFIQKV